MDNLDSPLAENFHHKVAQSTHYLVVSFLWGFGHTLSNISVRGFEQINLLIIFP